MKKQIVFQNVHELKNKKSAFEMRIQNANIILTEFEKLGIGSIKNDQIFAELCQSNTQNFVKNWMTNTVPDAQLKVAGGLKLSRTAVAQMIETPDLEGLKKAVEDHGINAFWALELGTIQENKMVFSPEKYAEIEKNFTIYAETPDEVKAFGFVSEMLTAAQKLIDMGAVFPEAFALSLGRAGITQQHLVDGKLSISERFCHVLKRKIGNQPSL